MEFRKTLVDKMRKEQGDVDAAVADDGLFERNLTKEEFDKEQGQVDAGVDDISYTVKASIKKVRGY